MTTATLIPDPLKVKTTCFTCACCKRHSCTIPDYDGEEIGECEGCGGTGFDMKPGRPIGPSSAKWTLVLEDFRRMEKYKTLDIPDVQDSFVMPEGFKWPED